MLDLGGKLMIEAVKRYIKKLQDFFSAREVLVLGDSHVATFTHSIFRKTMPLTRFRVCAVHGATVSGLENPNSVTNAMLTFRSELQAIRTDTIVITMIGEVDTGFVIWFRAEKNGISVDDAMDQAVGNYTRFIGELAARHRVIVVSTPLPTISDNNSWGEVANQRKEISASQIDRTDLTRRYNRSIENFCKQHEIPCINLDPLCIGADGLVLNELLNHDRTDHHYEPQAHAALLAPKIKVVLDSL